MSSDGNNDGQAKKAQAKKRQKVVQPVPPPSVCTALLILRGAAAGTLGCPIGANAGGAGGDSVTASLMQPSYLKDGYPSGKFSISLGKKTGTLCQVALPDGDDAEGCNRILDAIAAAANRIVAADMPIVTFRMDKAEAVARYGECILDAGQKAVPKKKKAKKKKKAAEAPEDADAAADADAVAVADAVADAEKAAPVTLAFLDGIVLAVPPGPVYARTSMLPGTIVLERGGSGQLSGINAGKKARKADITLKFKVDGAGASAGAPLASAGGNGEGEPVNPSVLEPLLSASVRTEEGRALVEEAAAAASADDAAVAADMEKVTLGADGDGEDVEMVVNAFEVSGKIDYSKLVNDFGSKLIDQDLLDRLERLTVGRGTVPRLHRFLRRGTFFSHRDLNKICDCLESGSPFYLYTGRGPSSGAMHLGHLVPFLFTAWLQRAFQCPLVIQMTDDEKFLFKGTFTEEDGDNLDHFQMLTIENARDIISCGFIKEKTFLFSDMDYVGRMYPNIVRIWKAVTANTVNGIFGFDGTSNIGKVAFPAIQAAPSFPSSFPVPLDATRGSNMACLIPCAIDQDPYFRMTRDVAHKLVPKSHPLGGKPALIHSKFFPPLQGADGKMSSSDPNSAVFLTDSADEIERKIKEYAFSGGQETKKMQEELGANLEVDVSYQWLRFFYEDDEELERIGKEYGSGSGKYWSTGAVKKKLVSVLQDIVKGHQSVREHVTDEVVQEWMTERCIL